MLTLAIIQYHFPGEMLSSSTSKIRSESGGIAPPTPLLLKRKGRERERERKKQRERDHWPLVHNQSGEKKQTQKQSQDKTRRDENETRRDDTMQDKTTQ
jgi:hypothetical protein